MSSDCDQSWRIPTLLIIATAFISQILSAGLGSLFNETDGQYAGAARAMVENGSWLIPENNGSPRLVKPPGLYWLIASAMKIFGVNEFAARLPGALATAAMALLAALITRHSGSWKQAATSAAIFSSMLGSFTLCRIVMPEPTFSLLIAASLWAFLRSTSAEPPARPLLIIAFWLFAGLASFIKGPHGILFPLLIAGISSFLLPGASLRQLFSPMGIILALAINIPWHLIVENRFPGYLSNLLLSEYLGHVAGSQTPATSYTNVPRITFILLHLAWFFPWSMLVIAAFPRMFRQVPPPSQWNPATRLSIVWMLVIGSAVLLAGQRQDYYAMSLWPAFAVASSALLEKTLPKLGILTALALLLISLLACLTAGWLLPSTPTGETSRRATAILTVLSLGTHTWRQLTTIAILALIPAICLLTIAALRKKFALPATFAASLCIGAGAVCGTSIVSPLFSLKDVAPLVLKNAEKIIFDGDLDTASSLLFYAPVPIYLVDILPPFAANPSNYITRQDAIRMLATSPHTILITESARASLWQNSSPTPLTHLATCGTMTLLGQPPSR